MRKALRLKELIEMYDSNDPEWKFLDNLSALQNDKKDKIQKLFDFCNDVNSVTEYHGKTQAQTTRIKGKALEVLAKYIFKYTGGLFEVYENLGTNTNEIDLFLKFSNKGKMLSDFIGKQYSKIICECKNYKDKVGVTYVGKFYSLVECSKVKLAILISWKGLGGDGWEDAQGLVKKIFLLKERLEDRIYILDFNKEDFNKILEGKPLIKILDEKCEELQMSIDYQKYFERHPNQDELEQKIDSILKE